MGSLAWIIFRAGSIIFFSMFLAAIALVYVGVEHPTMLEGMLVEASHVKEWLTNSANTGLNVRYNVWVKFLIQEQQFVFMFFVIVMRIALLLFFTAIQFLWRLVKAPMTQ